MNKKGFLLIEVLIGIFFLGLISITFFPIFTLASNQLQNVEIKNDMKYYGETIIEKIKAFDFNNDNDNEHILDINLKELIHLFYKKDDVNINLPLNNDKNFKYRVNIYKNNKGNTLWRITVKVYPKTNENEIEGVVFEAFVRKPEKE